MLTPNILLTTHIWTFWPTFRKYPIALDTKKKSNFCVSCSSLCSFILTLYLPLFLYINFEPYSLIFSATSLYSNASWIKQYIWQILYLIFLQTYIVKVLWFHEFSPTKSPTLIGCYNFLCSEWLRSSKETL